MKSSIQGQIALEFLLSMATVVAVFMGLSWIGMTYYLKIRCTELAFRNGRARLLKMAFQETNSEDSNHFVQTQTCKFGPLSTTQKIPFSRLESLGEGGQVTIPILALLFTFIAIGLGLLSFSRSVTRATQVQIHLDRCVGQAALKFKKKMMTVEITNDVIKVARAALVPGTLAPALGAALRILIELCHWTIEGIRGLHIAEQILWNTHRCGNLINAVNFGPSFPWAGSIRDPLGWQPYRFTGKEKDFYYEATQLLPAHRTARAEIRHATILGWETDWVGPKSSRHLNGRD